MSLKPGTRLANYEVLSELGRGGMGEVYKARDLKLRREVAIKVLPQEMASDAQRLRRFEQEARAASALNHPNIVTIYEIGDHEGTPYIAMEYVDGVSLREMLAGGPLPSDKIIRYATQMAEGLAKAHQAGIVHRDLKPENVVLSEDGYVKILDFGLAKLTPLRVDSEMKTMDHVVTEEGVILGTVHYMSPEQASGRSVDFRSDQFALGAILYEMAIGRRAFDRATAAETLTAIIREEPEPLTVENPELSPAVATVIHRCLEKDPAERYESTWDIAKRIHSEELAVPTPRASRHPLASVGAVGILAIVLVMIFGLLVSDIREWVSGASKIESIAVLPLRNLSGDPELEYFADGMTEALITNLGKIGALKVISRTSIMRFKETETTPSEIAQLLNVEAIVEGSAQLVGEQAAITVRLIDGTTEEQLWSEGYQRDMSDMLVLQNEVARAIARKIEVAVTPEETRRLTSIRATKPEAYEAYLKGIFHLSKLTPPDFELALSYFDVALEIDPEYAPAYAGIARVWGGFQQMGFVPPSEATPKSRAAVVRALQLDDSLAEAHAQLAVLATWSDWDWPTAEAAYQRAIELNPNYGDARIAYSHFLMSMKRPDEAMVQIDRALELDPLNDLYQAFYGVNLIFVRRYDDAIAQFEKVLTTSPSIPLAHRALWELYHREGAHLEALGEAKELYAVRRDREILDALDRGFAQDGYQGSMRVAAETLETRARTRFVAPFDVANFYLYAGNEERALDWMETAYEQRDPNMPYLGLPAFDHIRDDPRFQDLLRRMNFPE